MYHVPHVTRAQHASYMQNFSRHDALHALVCKLGCELYRMYIHTHTYVNDAYKSVSAGLKSPLSASIKTNHHKDSSTS